MKSIIKKYIGSILGTERHQEEIDTLFYFLNQYVDITKLPPATGALREVQLLDAKFLEVFDLLMQKHKLTYMLAYGSLLGGFRHKGFIPWDDDLDLFMPRGDYEAVKDILKMECDRFKFKYYINPNRWLESIGVGFTNGIWIDIFPLDFFSGDGEYESVYKKYLNAVAQIPAPDSLKLSWEDYVKKCNFEIKQSVGSGNARYFYRIDKKMLVRENDIFPLKKEYFEGYSVSFPQNSDVLLKALYGDYMSFPHQGIAKHGTENCFELETEKQTEKYLDELVDQLNSEIHK